MCVPYTIPLGIINQYVFPIDICYSEKKQDLTYAATTYSIGGSIGHNKMILIMLVNIQM